MRCDHGTQWIMLSLHELRFDKRVQLNQLLKINADFVVGLRISLKFDPIRLKLRPHNAEVGTP